MSLRDDFPTTSYFKYIDVWLIWYMLNLFIIISIHICLAMCVESATTNNTRIQPLSMTDTLEEKSIITQAIAKINLINRVAIIVFPIAMAVFTLVYFWMTL